METEHTAFAPPGLPRLPPSKIPDTLPSDARPVDVLGEKIAVLSAQIDAATWHLLRMIAEFDEGYGWEGFNSCAHWLNWRTGLALGAAREKVRVAKALQELPRISDALRRGIVSYSKVRAMTRVATRENEEELVWFAQQGTAAHVEKLVRYVGLADEDLAANREELRHEKRYLEFSTDEDGMVVVRGRLTPEVGAVLRKALEAASDKLFESHGLDEEETFSQRRADAIGVVAEAALAGDLDTGNRGDRYQVVVHTGETATYIEDGADVSAETFLRLYCDSSTVEMKHGSEGNVLDVGRRRRTVPPAIRRALTHRDAGCRFPGCGIPFCEAHHVRPWSEGGETKLDNMILLCRRHHRTVHEGGWRLAMEPGGRATFVDPGGRYMPEAPHTTLPPASPRQAIVDRLSEDGVEIRPRDIPTWDGGRCDWNDAVYNVIRLSERDVSAGTQSGAGA
jgi:hypothetical protein